jgi:putative transposase
VSRPNLISSLKRDDSKPNAPRGKAPELTDADVTARLEAIVARRPAYGYRRATRVLARSLAVEGIEPVNHKRVYKLMLAAGLLLPRFTGRRPGLKHDGKVITLRSNTRWCSDSLQIRCWDGRKVETAFVMDTCDREVLASVSVVGTLNHTHVMDMLVEAVEARFPDTLRASSPLQWLTDNGGIFTADETAATARSLGLVPCTTPAYSPESNGMSEAFVKRLKQDYVYVNELDDADVVAQTVNLWIEDYNECHPHSGLKMRSPREFRLAHSN